MRVLSPAAPRRAHTSPVRLMTVFLLAACGGGGGESPSAPPAPLAPTPPAPTPPPPPAPTPVAAVTLSSDSVDVPIRTSAALTATPRDAAGQPLAGRTITWESSAPAVASVTSAGMVSMLLPGTATITATSEGRSATARVRGSVADLARVVDSVRQAFGMPAMGAVIVARDGVVALGVGGTRRTGGPAVTAGDRWHLGSNTKAITGFLAGMAVDAGVLAWDRTVQQAFPDLAATTRAEYRDVTLRELLSHVSGVVNTTQGLTASPDLPAARTAWIRATLQAAPQNARGQYYYSNNGFGAAGAMIERVWGGSYESLLAARVFQPLGVTGAGWGPTTRAGASDQPVGHRWANGAWVACEACDNAPGLSSAGTLHAPLAAWARLTQELLRADQGRSALLTQATSRVITANAVPAGGGTSYGMGWGIGGTPVNRFVGHDGSNTTNHSRASVYLDAGVAFLTATNAADLDGGRSGSALGALTARLDSYWRTGR